MIKKKAKARRPWLIYYKVKNAYAFTGSAAGTLVSFVFILPMLMYAIGDARKIELKVPTNTPTIIANEKPADRVTTKDEDGKQHDQRTY